MQIHCASIAAPDATRNVGAILKDPDAHSTLRARFARSVLDRTPGQVRECLSAFYRYAYDSAVSQIIGHCSNPEITAAALENGAVVEDVFSGWAIHRKDTEVQQAILNGQVFWSQLDGESWLAFKGR